MMLQKFFFNVYNPSIKKVCKHNPFRAKEGRKNGFC